MKNYYCVTSSYDNKGHVVANITDIKEAARKPRRGFASTKDKDIYIDWFGSEKEAEKFVNECKNA